MTQGKVEICGANTSKLPLLKAEEKEALAAALPGTEGGMVWCSFLYGDIRSAFLKALLMPSYPRFWLLTEARMTSVSITFLSICAVCVSLNSPSDIHQPLRYLLRKHKVVNLLG